MVLNTIQRTGGGALTPASKNTSDIYYPTITHPIFYGHVALYIAGNTQSVYYYLIS